MTHYRSVHLLQAVMLCGLAALPAVAQTAADNTKVNARDRVAGAVTADQQKETAADRDLTKRIRQSVIGDKSLSLYAHNVKIVTRGGQVTLKGPVNSEAETAYAAQAAAAVVGSANVDTEPTPELGSEDFAFMLQARPGCYVWLGAGNGPATPNIHNPRYDFNDDVLKIGASYWVTLAEQQLQNARA